MLDLQVSEHYKPKKIPNTLLYQLLMCSDFVIPFIYMKNSFDLSGHFSLFLIHVHK